MLRVSRHYMAKSPVCFGFGGACRILRPRLIMVFSLFNARRTDAMWSGERVPAGRTAERQMIRLLVSRNGHIMIREVKLQRRVAVKLMALPRKNIAIRASPTCRYVNAEINSLSVGLQTLCHG